MSYNFSFDKKTITFLFAGCAFVGIMLFIAGLLIGTNLGTEQPSIAAVTTTTTSAQPAPAPVAVSPAPAPAPVAPVLKAPAAQPEESETPDETRAAPEPLSLSAKQAHSVARLESRREPAPKKFYNSGDDELKIVERANSSFTKADDLNKLNQPSFSVQVGVFLNEKEANQLVRQLQNKGYTPFVLATYDDESRMWYAVRIGTYADRMEATQAASNIAAQEKITTFVRPINSL